MPQSESFIMAISSSGSSGGSKIRGIVIRTGWQKCQPERRL